MRPCALILCSFQVSCGGNHTLVHAVPIDNEFVNNSVQQTKSSDTLPPLKVVKKKIDEHIENLEPFTIITATITKANGYDLDVLNINGENVKVRICLVIILCLF